MPSNALTPSSPYGTSHPLAERFGCAQDTMVPPFTQHSRLGPLYVLVLAAIGIDITVARGETYRSNEALLGCVIGTMFGQIAIAAVATMLLRRSLPIRIVLGLAATLFVCACLACHLRNTRPLIPFVLSAAALSQWLIYQVPLSCLRWKGWRLHSQRPSMENHALHEKQFDILQIFLWTTFVAVLLALARVIHPIVEGLMTPTSIDIAIFVILAVGNSALSLPMTWGFLIQRFATTWIVASIVWVILVTPVQLQLLRASAGLSHGEEWIFIGINVSQSATVMIFLVTLRWAGFRLQRLPEEMPTEVARPHH